MKKVFVPGTCALVLLAVVLSRLAVPPRVEPEDFLRFRVVAASDAPQDQEAKLAVRDAVLAYLRPVAARAGSREAVASYIAGNLPEIAAVARDAARAAGFSGEVRLFWGEVFFPPRPYGDCVLPGGKYKALQVVLGSGKGRNWWCVLFPPLCYVDLARAGSGSPGRGEGVSLRAARVFQRWHHPAAWKWKQFLRG